MEEKISNLRKKLEDSILRKEDYFFIYKLSIELDDLISKNYKN